LLNFHKVFEKTPYLTMLYHNISWRKISRLSPESERKKTSESESESKCNQQ
jgi:hypothetical protein